MVFASLFTLLAAVWATFVTSLVLQSAEKIGDAQLWAFDRLVYTPESAEDGVLILCVLSASAALALVTGIAMIRGRRLERRMAAELDSRIATRMQRDAGDSAVSRLLDARVAELQTSVDTLTAQRDAIYEEIRELRTARGNGTIGVVTLPDVADVAETPGAQGDDEPEATPADRGEQARA